jgi:hypothetical protein
MRASANGLLEPKIVISPAFPGEVRGTDQEELKSATIAISLKNRKSIHGTTWSLVTLNARQFTLYCQRLDSAPFGIHLFINLYCGVATVPYSFSYNGPPTYEKEAESILSTLE